MTMPTRPSDDELRDRIRAATGHYTFDHPVPAHRTARGVLRRWLPLLAAALAGAAVALAGVAVLDRFATPVGVGQGSSGTPSPSTATSPSRSAVPRTAAPSPVSTAAATELCLADPGEIPDDWLQPGETPEGLRAALRSLPLLHEEQRDHAALFLYGDRRFFVVCSIDRTSADERGLTVVHGLREDPGDDIAFLGGTSSGGGTDPGGRISPPDLMVVGSAGPDIDRVEAVLEDGGTVPAWLGEGMWVAWWNDSVGSVSVRGHHRDGTVTILDEGMDAVVMPLDGVGDPACELAGPPDAQPGRVLVYFECGTLEFRPVAREAEAGASSDQRLAVALRALFGGPEPGEIDLGYGPVVPAGWANIPFTVSVTPESTAVIDFDPSILELAPPNSGSQWVLLSEGIRRTIAGVVPIGAVEVHVGGSCEAFTTWMGELSGCRWS